MSRFALVLVLATVVGLLGPGVAGAATPPQVEPGVYLSDVRAGTAALQSFGQTLSNAKSVASLAKKAPALRRQLFRFDRRFYVVGRYWLADPVINNQRARLARTAPGVTEVLSEFVDAVITNDRARLNRLVPKVASRVSAFEAAAQM